MGVRLGGQYASRPRVRRPASPRVVPGASLYDLGPTALSALARVTNRTRDLLAGKQQVTGPDNHGG